MQLRDLLTRLADAYYRAEIGPARACRCVSEECFGCDASRRAETLAEAEITAASAAVDEFLAAAGGGEEFIAVDVRRSGLTRVQSGGWVVEYDKYSTSAALMRR